MISPNLLHSSTKNFLLETLQTQLPTSGEDPKLDWLVVTHDDAPLIRRLTASLGGKDHAVLPLHQAAWNFEQGHLRQAIETTLELCDLDGMIVVGHSQALVPMSARHPTSNDAAGRSANTSRIVRGATEIQTDLANAKRQFQQSFERLLAIPAIHSRVAQQQLSVVGLFYLAESGIFLSYDFDSQEFAPLISPS